ncbi:MAG TPA: hypothetical protein VNF07_09490 [Acidimicrobiales bacterium]|nr:hypothetical protein [Acidimicrobiales bacterium]
MPPWLREHHTAYELGLLEAAELEADHRAAVASVLANQQAIGLPILTDGELSRRNFQESFGSAVSGYDALPQHYPPPAAYPTPGPAAAAGRPAANRIESGGGVNGPPIEQRRPVIARLQLVRNVILEEYLRSSSLTDAPVKVTLVGPDRIAQRFAHEDSTGIYDGLDDFVDHVVAIEQEMIAAVVAAGCRYVQIDEPGYTAYVDPVWPERMRRRGEDPAENLGRSIAADNALRAPFPDVTFAIHICRGGGGGRGGPGFHRQGHYDAIAEQLYGELAFDRFLLEYDSEEAGGFESLRYLPKNKISVLGLVSNHGEVEPPDYLRRRLDEATAHLPIEQVALCPRCGFHNETAESKVWGKLARLVELSTEVWG